MSQSPRVAPAEPPYPPEIQARFDKIMPPGVPPLLLFRVLGRDARLFERFAGGSLLDAGNVSLRERELVIHRITARCGSLYEWGVHAAFFAKRAGIDQAQLQALAKGASDAACWSPAEQALLAYVDSLDDQCDVDDALWERMRAHYSELAILEITLLAGFYRTVAYLTNALRLPPERFGRPFPA